MWAFACGDHDIGYILDCLFLACVLYDLRGDRCLATWLTDCSPEQLLWCLCLFRTLSFSTVEYLATCVFHDVGASLFVYWLLRHLSI